ncbi:MAG: OmpP1/FadL family transporter [Pseudomonadota bacterium]
MQLKLAFMSLTIASVISTPANATNGYFKHGYGTISSGMAGATTAFSQDSIAAASNPAGMAFIGNRTDAGVELFSPRRKYTVDGGTATPPPGTFYLAPGTRKSRNNLFTIPHLGANRQLNRDHSLGVSVFANGGLNTEYGSANGGTFGSGTAGVNLEQLFIAPTWSWKFSDNQAIGLSPVIAYQRFEAKGLSNFSPFSSNPDALSNRGTDEAWGYGFQIGWQGEVTENLRAGVSWRTILEMEEFEKYEGLFAEQGDFDIPQMFSAGLAWSGIQDHWLAIDVQHIRYSEINSVGNPFQPNVQTARLGDDDGAGFGWEDMTIVKLGWQWQQNASQTWRAGISYGSQPIPDEEVLFSILAPAVPEWHFTGGFTHSFSNDLEVSGMAFYAPGKSVKGDNPLGPGQSIELRMHQIGMSASLGYSF